MDENFRGQRTGRPNHPVHRRPPQNWEIMSETVRYPQQGSSPFAKGKPLMNPDDVPHKKKKRPPVNPDGTPRKRKRPPLNADGTPRRHKRPPLNADGTPRKDRHRKRQHSRKPESGFRHMLHQIRAVRHVDDGARPSRRGNAATPGIDDASRLCHALAR